MPYTDLLRVTVFLTGAEATALATITAIAANRDSDTTTLIVAAAWWLIVAGRSASTWAAPRAPPTASATPSRGPAPPPRCRRRRRPGSPSAASGRSAATAIVAGVLGVFFPGVAAIGAGYALLVSLAWHSREAAVLAIEQRDGVKFYVVPNSALRPIQLVRTPGLRSDRRADA